MRAPYRSGPVSSKGGARIFLSRPYGRGGTQAGGLGGEGLAESGVQTLTSHRFAAGPSSPAKSGRGFIAALSGTGCRCLNRREGRLESGEVDARPERVHPVEDEVARLEDVGAVGGAEHPLEVEGQ